MLYGEILADPEEVLYNKIRRDGSLRHPSMPYAIYARDVQGKRLIDVVIKRRVKKAGPEVSIGYDYVARMREARLRVDAAEGLILLESDRVVMYEKNASVTLDAPPPYSWPLPDSVSGKEALLRIGAQTWDDLPVRIAAVGEERDEILRQRDARQREIDGITDPTVRTLAQADLQHNKFLLDAKTRQLRNLQAEVHARPALALSCLVFALIGCPVGIWANRADYLSTFVVCFIPTLVLYYPLLLAGSDMGKSGKLPLALGCWLADIVLGAMALVLTWRLLRR
jgi:lipopolysaccharide export system permease protein